MRAWAVVVALAGCDKLLGLGDIQPTQFVAAGPATIAAGTGHTCWIRSDGALFCWGDNDTGQLGIAANVAEDDAIGQIGDAKWSAISASRNVTCGIQLDGSLWCWGDNANGEVATGDTTPVGKPTAIRPGERWRKVSVSTTHVCAVRSDATLWCWGDNQYGELGDGTIADSTAPNTLPEMIATHVIDVAVGGFHTCALADDHTLSCWGLGGSGQRGDGTFTMLAPSPVNVDGDLWAQITSGLYHTCGITQTGRLRCWGAQYAGQLGTGNGSDKNVPSAVLLNGLDATDWIGVAAGDRHTCAWTADQAYCFGDSSHGELAIAGNAVNASPVALPGGPWIALALGNHHTCGLDATGALWCVGANGWGQLGTGNTSQLAPQLVASAEAWQFARAGTSTTCAMNTGGHYACGGDNFFGQLGVGDYVSRQTLGMVEATYWGDLSAGADYMCGFDNPGQLYCWGGDGNGQLGNGSTTGTALPEPVALPGTGTVAAEIVTSDHTCARDGSGHLYCWGLNDHGQLALPTTTKSLNMPGSMIPLTALFRGSVAVGNGFTCAIDDPTNASYGKVYCWGRNNYGQVGNGSTTGADVITPTAVSSMLFYRLFAGPLHVCALQQIGTSQTGNVWCWGYNGAGEIGNGASVQTTPVQIGGQWQALALGFYHTCAISTDQTGKLLSCWGDNRRGQVGTNDPSRATFTPATQIGNSRWDSIAAGAYHTCGVSGAQLYCWGANDDGALLDGKGWTATLQAVPTP